MSASTMFSSIVEELTGKNLPNTEAKDFWRKALSHKRALETKIGRPISIITAFSDFLDVAGLDENLVLSSKATLPRGKPATDEAEVWMERVLVPGHHLVKLKEEAMRVRRYKHALSSILLEIDDFDILEEPGKTDLLTMVVKIVRKTIRTVDIVARCAGGRFMVILPDTNQREARELANRLRINIRDRTKRMVGAEAGARITASVAQYGHEEKPSDFVRRLESALESGEKARRDAVYVA